MSNYYISNCCQSQVSEIFNEYEGVCGECKEPCDLEAVIDEYSNKYMNESKTIRESEKFSYKYCGQSNPMIDKDGICVWCGERIYCDWWHNIKHHNMPLTWDISQSFKDKKAQKRLKEHLHFHVGWLAEQIFDSLEAEYKQGYNQCLKDRGLTGEEYQHLYL